jgi:hypothetical protein
MRKGSVRYAFTDANKLVKAMAMCKEGKGLSREEVALVEHRP